MPGKSGIQGIHSNLSVNESVLYKSQANFPCGLALIAPVIKHLWHWRTNWQARINPVLWKWCKRWAYYWMILARFKGKLAESGGSWYLKDCWHKGGQNQSWGTQFWPVLPDNDFNLWSQFPWWKRLSMWWNRYPGSRDLDHGLSGEAYPRHLGNQSYFISSGGFFCLFRGGV